MTAEKKSDPLAVDIAEIPLPPEELTDALDNTTATDADPAKAQPARPEVAALDFLSLERLVAIVPLDQSSSPEAKKGAAARAQQLSRFTGTGSFEGPGRPEAVAGAPVKCSGFGAAIDGIEWEASGVTHEIEPENGWITTIEVQTREQVS